MRGYCKCDICSSTYHKDDNKYYDGIAVWYYDEDGDIMCGKRDCNITGPDGKLLSNVPEMMDICPNCFERFCNWIRMARNESKSPVNDKDFPMNKPE